MKPAGWTKEQWEHYLRNESAEMRRRRERYAACLKAIKAGGDWKAGQAAADRVGPEL